MPTPDVASYAQRFGLTVTPENVLGVREVVLGEAHQLQDLLYREIQFASLDRLGGDPVSGDMSRDFNALTKSLFDRANEHVTSLFVLGDELAATARAYGHTEEQIKATLTPTAVSGLSPTFKHLAGLA